MVGRRLLFAAPLLALGLAGCGAGTLEAATVEEGAADALEAQVGATIECTLTAGDDPTEYPVTVTVSSVDGDSANFDVEVGEEPAG